MREKEKAEELFKKFYCLENNSNKRNKVIEFNTAKQCALIVVENEYHSLREQLINLRSCGLIQNNNVYLTRLQKLIDEEQGVKQEIENL